MFIIFFFFFSSRRRHTRLQGDWSSDVCSSDLGFCERRCGGVDDARCPVRTGWARRQIPRDHSQEENANAEQVPTGERSRFDPRRRSHFRRCAGQRERAESRCHPWTPRGHDSPARRVQEPVDRKGRAAIALASVSRIEPRTYPPFRDAPVQEHSNRLVIFERPLEKLVQVSAIVPHDEELRNPPGLVSVAWLLR